MSGKIELKKTTTVQFDKGMIEEAIRDYILAKGLPIDYSSAKFEHLEWGEVVVTTEYTEEFDI